MFTLDEKIKQTLAGVSKVGRKSVSTSMNKAIFQKSDLLVSKNRQKNF